MEEGESPCPGKQRRTCCVILCVVVALLVIIIVAVVLGQTAGQKESGFQSTFVSRCERFGGKDCQNLWRTFQQAYVDKNPCEIPPEAYEPLLAAAPFEAECGRMMFWSKTKEVVHDFSNTCFTTLEDTLLGSVLNELTWCGKEGNKDTVTADCPTRQTCPNNSVSSFWASASAAFADVACGNVTAMLNGSISTPFSPTSIFGSIEVKRFNATRTKSLNVVMVIQKNAVTNCANDASLKNLQGEMENKGIKYNCKDVTESRLQECSSKPVETCGKCW